MTQVWGKIKNLIPNRPNWSESNSNSSSYIQNRTHYKESIGDTIEVNLSQYYLENAVESPMPVNNVEYTYLLADTYGQSIEVLNGLSDMDLSVETTTVIINGVEQSFTNEFIDPYNLFIYNGTYLIAIGIDDANYYISLFSTSTTFPEDVYCIFKLANERFEYFKLDDNYLNGSLIKSGVGEYSELFNLDKDNCVEIPIYVTGNDGDTTYSFYYTTTFVSLLEESRLIPNTLFAIDNILLVDDLSASIVSISDVYYSWRTGQTRGNITFSATIGARTDSVITISIPKKIANGKYSHAEGHFITACGHVSHAEGENTIASGNSSHAEGWSTKASGDSSHAEGENTIASGNSSHAEGSNTVAQGKSQHVFGEYNIQDTDLDDFGKGTYVEIVGNGIDDNYRSNARTLDWNGNEVLAGKLTVGAAPTNNMDVATKKYVDDHSGVGAISDLSDTTISSPINNQVLMYDSSTSKWKNNSIPTDTSRAAVSDVLTKTNTTSYSPTGDYHPATKKYVDDLSLDISNNVIQLKRGTTVQSSITLPVYNGGVS